MGQRMSGWGRGWHIAFGVAPAEILNASRQAGQGERREGKERCTSYFLQLVPFRGCSVLDPTWAFPKTPMEGPSSGLFPGAAMEYTGSRGLEKAEWYLSGWGRPQQSSQWPWIL